MIRRTIISLACALMMTVSKAAAEDPWDTLTFEKLDRVAEAALGNAQDLSLENNREYCGYIAFDGEERLRFTAPLKGSVETCTPPEVPDGRRRPGTLRPLTSLQRSGHHSNNNDIEERLRGG